MRSFSRRRASKTRAPQELKAAPVDVSNEAVEALVKQTVSSSMIKGLPDVSRKRIKRGLEKLKADTETQPGGTPSRSLRGRALLFGLIFATFAAFLVPLWLFLTALFMAFAGTIGFLTLMGPERISAWVVARYHRLQGENPDKAERLRIKAARMSAKIEAFAARLPEKWVQGLYLPDFEPSADLPEKMQTDPFERLSV
ncbi:MAG: hypothetical protein AB3N11_11660 [Arenibacterium sp.]